MKHPLTIVKCYVSLFFPPRVVLGASLLPYSNQKTHTQTIVHPGPRNPQLYTRTLIEKQVWVQRAREVLFYASRKPRGGSSARTLPQRLFCTPQSTAARYNAAAANRLVKSKELTSTQQTACSSHFKEGNLHPKHQKHFNLSLK